MDTPRREEAPSEEKSKKEAFHREAEARRVPFRYAPPEATAPRSIYFLGRTDILKAQVQIVKEGGEITTHYHPTTDGFWWVITGKVRFHGVDGLIGEYGPGEGILMPRNARYWFETADPNETLQLLQVGAHVQQSGVNKSIHVNGRPDRAPTPRFNDPAPPRRDETSPA